ncbi:hypothetical protein ACG04R_18520 [Roseateles sp. BYS78W]|uniref:Uncharacterized protein n=1 Tax=Pelomonas candidula TaxID=3299025 RepID=A0ABW7HG56_9BURK
MRSHAAALAALVIALPASAASTPADFAQATLRDGCAQSYASHIAYYPDGSQPFTGERYKGDNRYYNDAKPCDESQYAAYLEKADPATVTMAYPTAAGKKKDKAKKPGSAASATKPK